jgi:CubicO group peptidase (beta-lactamase class C family)
MAEVHGSAEPRFDRLSDLLSESIDSGHDVGASVSVTVEGETVVDLWGGWTDERRTTPWQADTIVNVWSTTKTLMALVALVCADRGLIDLDSPVAAYWPEFAANGKEGVLVKHLLSHTSGVAGWDGPIEPDVMYDWERSTAMLAAQAPWWEPGTASGYHSMSQGHLVGEVVRRVTGKKLGLFFKEEIAEPFDLDFHIGLAPEHDPRVSNVIPYPGTPVDVDALDPNSPKYKQVIGPRIEPEIANTTPWRRADLSAANGHGNARSVARAQAIVANGGTLDGVQLLSPATIDRIFETQSDGIDLIFQEHQKFGIGYALPTPLTFHPEGKICYWGGMGGSKIIVDVGRRMTFSYVMNRMDDGLLGDFRGENLATATWAALRTA